MTMLGSCGNKLARQKCGSTKSNASCYHDPFFNQFYLDSKCLRDETKSSREHLTWSPLLHHWAVSSFPTKKKGAHPQRGPGRWLKLGTHCCSLCKPGINPCWKRVPSRPFALPGCMPGPSQYIHTENI